MLNTQSKHLLKATTVIVTSATLMFAFTGSAMAAPTTFATSANSKLSFTTTYGEKVEHLANDLEILFTRYIPQVNGKFTVSEANVIIDGLQSEITKFQTVADTFNAIQAGNWKGNEKPNHSGGITTLGAKEFALCVLEVGVGIPASAFTTGTLTAITRAISAWNWGLAASTIARALGPAFVTGAGKVLGGPVVIAGVLAAGAGICAWKQYT